MITTCVINDYYNSNLVYRAIDSAIQCDNIVVIRNQPLSNRYEKIVDRIETDLSNVGDRFLLGCNYKLSDIYFLLDYDDEYKNGYVHNSIETYRLHNFDIIKDCNKLDTTKNIMYNVINYNIDWHISQYSFNNDFKNYLNKINTELPMYSSFDKILFSLGLNRKFNINKYCSVIKHNNKMSRTHFMSNKFYKITYYEFMYLNKLENEKLSNYYNTYEIMLNKFLYDVISKENKSDLTNDYIKIISYEKTPLIKKLYYRYLLFNYNLKKKRIYGE